ncbi:hypothetical protein AB0D57_47345 [Streptomyces sp. NPDC048275]|uniref:hypothetical protein n=1 Tax=Streptomyces sp. NPDC048275 TaxID=3155629 RepID=UPI00340184BB
MAEYEGVDALWAAITDEPLPEEAHDDAGFMAEHGSAAADVALLREQLTAIGEELAADRTETAAKPAPVRASRKRARRPEGAPRNRGRRPLALALGGFAVAAVAAMVVGMGWLLAQGAGAGLSESSSDRGGKAADSAGSEASLSGPGYLACSRLVVEGTIAEVEPLPGTTLNRITLDVDRYYKPEKGKSEVVVVLDEEVAPDPRKGRRVLVAVQDKQATPDGWTTGQRAIARERAWILQALPESRTVTCP